MTLNMGVSAPSYPSTCNEFEGRLVCVHVCVCVCVGGGGGMFMWFMRTQICIMTWV